MSDQPQEFESEEPKEIPIDWENMTPEQVMAEMHRRDKAKEAMRREQAERDNREIEAFKAELKPEEPEITEEEIEAGVITLEDFVDQLILALNRRKFVPKLPDNIEQYCHSMKRFMDKEATKIHNKKAPKDRL